MDPCVTGGLGISVKGGIVTTETGSHDVGIFVHEIEESGAAARVINYSIAYVLTDYSR